MNTASLELLAVSSQQLGVFAAFIGGMFVSAALIWAVRLGMSIRDRELPPPDPEEQPHLPPTGPVHETREVREPDEVPHATQESERLMPYELHHAPSRRGEHQERKRWHPGSSGSFGSGGPGHV
ncbi:DUF6479 family protein [Streptomyces sp. RY43-2]|uniref:DUF6479 family protein n=1 Tax=Streptomyces macrolidinus TaxID=2952607 RepID=A0ABT0ZF20_9ACTN|nr:DUF6479 family protein [Streptomyces macrolidinus]MCN9242163.1 DUF6479 family protein [Streptomyces macrolidinus]